MSRAAAQRASTRSLVGRHSSSGFGSGQALVDTVRDGRRREPQGHRHHRRRDGRTCSEPARLRDSTLSETLRKAFDGEPLEWRTRSARPDRRHRAPHRRARGDHRRASCVAARRDGDQQRARQPVLVLWSSSSTRCPFGGNIDEPSSGRVADVIGERLGGALRARVPRSTDDTRSESCGSPFYLERRNGMSSAGAGQGARRPACTVHAARLAIVYAALDGATMLGAEHFKAAMAWCDYGLDTVRSCSATASPARARKLLEAIREAGATGSTARPSMTCSGATCPVTSWRRSARRARAARTDLDAEVPTGGRPGSSRSP